MCLGMNADHLEPGERCASTSNRNFEGRQGQGGRTHLVSPAMATAADMTIAEVRRSQAEAIHPESVQLSGVYVDRVVTVSDANE